MGKLADALSPASSYAAKKTGIWDQIVARIDLAMTRYDLEEVEAWLLGQSLNIPGAWEEPILELLEKRAEAIDAEDIGLILRNRFEF
jgi:hypothetical protein